MENKILEIDGGSILKFLAREITTALWECWDGTPLRWRLDRLRQWTDMLRDAKVPAAIEFNGDDLPAKVHIGSEVFDIFTTVKRWHDNGIRPSEEKIEVNLTVEEDSLRLFLEKEITAVLFERWNDGDWELSLERLHNWNYLFEYAKMPIAIRFDSDNGMPGWLLIGCRWERIDHYIVPVDGKKIDMFDVAREKWYEYHPEDRPKPVEKKEWTYEDAKKFAELMRSMGGEGDVEFYMKKE